MSVAIRIENVSKLYRLGTVGTGTISHDLNRWWHRVRGKDDPYAKVGQVNDRTKVASNEQRDASEESAADSPLAPRNSQLRATGPDYVWALKDINLEVEQGEILGIIGRNGAGKSTLLKLLSRVTAPTTGSIKTKGRIASLLEVGTGFHPELTGRENIYMNGAILGMRRNEITRQLESIVEFSGCAKYLDTPTKRYSSGMMVRLGFAVAAHLRCEVLIVDEVLAVGDAEFQRKSIGKMGDVAASGRTILLVSHNMQTMQRLCKRSVQLDSGVIRNRGTVDSIVADYVNQQIDQCSNEIHTSSYEALAERFGLALDKVKTFNSVGNLVTSFRHGDAIRIQFQLRSLRKAPRDPLNFSSISFAITVSDLTGSKVLHFHSFTKSLNISSTGETQVEAIFRNILNVGDFLIGIWIGDQNNRALCHVPNCLRIHSSAPAHQSPLLKAGVVVPCTWTAKQSNQS